MFDLRKLFRAPEAKASRTAQLVALQTQGRARWTPRETVALAREGYMKNAIVHRAVRLVAENVASVSWLAYDGAAEHDAHPLLDLIARPNPRQDGAVFLESVVTHLELAGNAYIEAVTLDGRPRELHALRPDRMRVVPGSDGWPEAYEYHVAGRSVRFEQGQGRAPILHLTHFHPLDDHYGFAPLEAASVAVDTHNGPPPGTRRSLTTRRAPPARSSIPGRSRPCCPTGNMSGSSASWKKNIRARRMPAARCCSKAGSTGRRCHSRPRTWISSRRSTMPRARSRSSSACRRCCSGFRPGCPVTVSGAGIAVARDLVLTAAHCVPPGADYKLVEFDAQHGAV